MLMRSNRPSFFYLTNGPQNVRLVSCLKDRQVVNLLRIFVTPIAVQSGLELTCNGGPRVGLDVIARGDVLLPCPINSSQLPGFLTFDPLSAGQLFCYIIL